MPAVPPSTIVAVAAATRRRCLTVRGRSGTGSGACGTRDVSDVSEASASSRARRSVLNAGLGVAPTASPPCSRSSATTASSRPWSPAEATPTGASTSAANSSARLRWRNWGLIWAILGATWAGGSVRLTSDGCLRLWAGAFQGSSQPLGEQLRQVPHGSQLQLLHRTLRAAQHRGGLGYGQALQEPHDEALLLLVGQLLQRREEGLVRERGEHGAVRAFGREVVV